MWSSEVTNMIITGIWETLYMTLVSTLVGYVIGLPMGIILTVSDKDGIKPNAVLYKILDVIANIVRSVRKPVLCPSFVPDRRKFRSHGRYRRDDVAEHREGRASVAGFAFGVG